MIERSEIFTHAKRGDDVTSNHATVDNRRIQEVFEKISHHRKRTPLVSEVSAYLHNCGFSCTDEQVSRLIEGQGLPAVTPQKLLRLFEQFRQQRAVGLSPQLSTSDFSQFLRREHNIILGRQFLKDWNKWAKLIPMPAFKFRARAVNDRDVLRKLLYVSYVKALRELRASGVRTRFPRFEEVYSIIHRRTGNFNLSKSGVRQLLRELSEECKRKGRPTLRFHGGGSDFNDTVERTHRAFIMQYHRVPTYHDIAQQLSVLQKRKVGWESIRTAYRAINGHRPQYVPPLEIQMTKQVYDTDIIAAHARINQPKRPPTLQELLLVVRAECPQSHIALSTLVHKLTSLRRRGHVLPTRHYTITKEMVKKAYEKVKKIVENIPTVEEVRTVLLQDNPEVREISKDAIKLHLKLLRREGGAYAVVRLRSPRRLEKIVGLSRKRAGAFKPVQYSFINRYELPEKVEVSRPVIYLSGKNQRLTQLIVNALMSAQDDIDLFRFGRTLKVVLQARGIARSMPRKATTTTPILSALTLGTKVRERLTADEWKLLLAFAKRVVLPQMGLTDERLAVIHKNIPETLLSIENKQDPRSIILPCLKYHHPLADRSDGAFSDLEIIEIALRRAFTAEWRVR